MDKVTSYLSKNKKPILIGFAVVLGLIVVYHLFYYQSGGGSYDRRFFEGYKSDSGESAKSGASGASGKSGASAKSGALGKSGASDSGSADDSDVKKIVLYYSPTCPHCHTLMEGSSSPWQEFRKRITGRKDVKAHEVNCKENPDMAQKNNIQGYPTIRLYYNGQSIDYTGERSADALEQFATSS